MPRLCALLCLTGACSKRKADDRRRLIVRGVAVFCAIAFAYSQLYLLAALALLVALVVRPRLV